MDTLLPRCTRWLRRGVTLALPIGEMLGLLRGAYRSECGGRKSLTLGLLLAHIITMRIEKRDLSFRDPTDVPCGLL